MKDVLKLQPSEAQVYSGIPWIIKPLWGLMTDIVPIFRLRYLLLSAQTCQPAVCAILSFMTIDACVTENSISHPSLAGDMQSLCGVSSSIGQLVGFGLSGVLVHIMVRCGLVILVGLMLQEPLVHSYSHKRVRQKFLDAIKTMVTALKTPAVNVLLVHRRKNGPIILTGGYRIHILSGSLLGVLLYQNVFRSHPFRGVLFWTQLLYGASSLLDLALVLRLNLKLNVPDYIFVVMDEAVSKMIGRLRWMPLLVLSSKLCPSGIEGTFFALLMSIDHIGTLTSSWAGSVLLHALNVTRTRFDSLWVAIFVPSFRLGFCF
ncbi:putative MFS transporter superfamily, biopterin transporter family [Helianthus annuus]|nr:putative MFS transporter superfamily, biopterin transporter family [Helianthus annuus]